MCRLESGIFRIPLSPLSAGAALVCVENEGVEKAHLGKYE